MMRPGPQALLVVCAIGLFICACRDTASGSQPRSASRATFQVVVAPSNLRPDSLMQARDGSFYGTSRLDGPERGGAVFRVTADGQLVILHAFSSRTPTNAEGIGPVGPLIETPDGAFLGVTSIGGTSGEGTIFKIGSEGTVTTLHSFTGADGAKPEGPLVAGPNGIVYGRTSSGPRGASTIFALVADRLRTLHRFDGDAAGRPAGLLLARDGNLYVATTEGGARGGTIIRITSDGVATTLHEFRGGADGLHPTAALTQTRDGRFYGTTNGGATADQLIAGVRSGSAATVFTMSEGGRVTTLHRFDDGIGSPSTLREGRDGSLYGSTGVGGVFQIINDGSLVMLHPFQSIDHDYSGVVPADDGSLWGAASGRLGGGMIFKIVP